jgi:hypothetical protein
MSKKPSKTSKAGAVRKGPINPPGDDFFDVLGQLVAAGYVRLATNDDGDDAVAVALPDELLAPKDVDAETQRAEDRLLIADRILPARLEKLLRAEALALWRGFAKFKLVPLIQSLTGREAKEVLRFFKRAPVEKAALRFVEQVVFQGFDFALMRYADQIEHVPELHEWRKRRSDGGAKGRRTSSTRREHMARRIRDELARMTAAGEQPTNTKLAAACGCSVSTVIRAFKTEPAKRSKR